MRIAPGLASGTTLILAPVALVGAWGLAPGLLAVPLAVAALVPAHRWLRRRERRLDQGAAASPSRERLWVALLLLAVLQLGRVGVFVVDPVRRGWAALPMAAEWAVYHACFTGYTEAARLAGAGGVNIYDARNYETPDGHSRRIGLLRVDEYEYPPPFLPLPALLAALTGHDVVRGRALFFGLQGFVLVLAMVASALRLPGPASAFAWRLLPGVIAAFQTVVGMQYGNFQAGAFALAMAGMLAATGGRVALGTPLLAFSAASKLFPGVLAILLAARRRWRAFALNLAWGAAFAVLSLALFGWRPYADFVFYQLPQISTGSGFGWSADEDLIPTNYGVSGLVLKLGALGLPGASFGSATRIASVYGLAVVALAMFVGWRISRGGTPTPDSPLLWLALLNLASFRSPYVADAQATMGTLWLLALLVPLAGWSGWRLGLAVVAWSAWALTFEGLTPDRHVPLLLILTLALQSAAIAFNVWVVSTALRRPWALPEPPSPSRAR